MNNPFSVMPGLAGLMGMGGMGSLNNSQITNMWGGMGGPRNMPPMGFNRGMMEQVKYLTFNTNTLIRQSHGPADFSVRNGSISSIQQS